jgi:caa(3)-type oxidase subunit IV
VRRLKDAPTRVAVVWLVLLTATFLSWESARSSGEYRLASAVVLLIAFLKARLIGLEFMELRTAPPLLRFVFEAWVVVACGTLLAIYSLSAPAPGSVL